MILQQFSAALFQALKWIVVISMDASRVTKFAAVH